MGHVAKSHTFVTCDEVIDAGGCACLPPSASHAPTEPYCIREHVMLGQTGERIFLPDQPQRYRLQAIIAHYGMANAVRRDVVSMAALTTPRATLSHTGDVCPPQETRSTTPMYGCSSPTRW